jgi:rubrerythrin
MELLQPYYQQAKQAVEQADWVCPQCGETVPGTFEICWNCQYAKEATPL